MVLQRLDFTIDDAIALFEKYPNGVGKKYQGRLRVAVEDIYAKLNRPRPGAQAQAATAQPDRTNLLLSNWLNLKLPPRDRLLGDVLHTTSRWILLGDTGIGKTLFAMAIAGASGCGLLGWQASGRPRRIMFLDGEMPAETFKERVETIAALFGSDL